MYSSGGINDGNLSVLFISIPGLLLSVCGVVFMLENPTSGGLVYVLVSFGSGITVVLSRMVNAHLSAHIGALQGVITVVICNVVVPKIPAYRMTLFSFCGQLFCGILLDLVSVNSVNRREFYAGLLVAAGIAVSQLWGLRIE